LPGGSLDFYEIEQRRVSLHYFLQDILSDAKLNQHELFKTFLKTDSMDEEEFLSKFNDLTKPKTDKDKQDDHEEKKSEHKKK